MCEPFDSMDAILHSQLYLLKILKYSSLFNKVYNKTKK